MNPNRARVHPHGYAKPAQIFGPKPAESPRRFPRGTSPDISPRIAAPARLDELGDKWFYSYRLETLGRNMATAGALLLAYRLGLAHAEFELMRRGES